MKKIINYLQSNIKLLNFITYITTLTELFLLIGMWENESIFLIILFGILFIPWMYFIYMCFNNNMDRIDNQKYHKGFYIDQNDKIHEIKI